MAVGKLCAAVLVVALLASANAEIYFNRPVDPKVAEALATANELLCDYTGVNCGPGQSGFTLPPAPSPPGSTPAPDSAPTPTAAVSKEEIIQTLLSQGRKLKM